MGTQITLIHLRDLSFRPYLYIILSGHSDFIKKMTLFSIGQLIIPHYHSLRALVHKGASVTTLETGSTYYYATRHLKSRRRNVFSYKYIGVYILLWYFLQKLGS